jgi:hypothetical protein
MATVTELKLEHLACYLPYGLSMVGCQSKLDATILGKWISGDWDITPILKPLSELENFLPEILKKYNEVSDNIERIDFHTLGGFILFGLSDNENKEVSVPYWVYEMVLAEHFDIYELIDAGLAIDYNTIKK